jgi:ankyrin repeat protein
MCDSRYSHAACMAWLGRFLVVALWAAALHTSAHAGAYEDFFVAIKNDQAQTVKALLDRGMDPNTLDPQGFPAPVQAARQQAWNSLDLLMQAKGVKLDARSKQGETALMYAVRYNKRPVVEKLIAKGAEVNQTGWTALHYAATFGHDDLVKLLLDQHAYIDAESPNKTTPIMMAARHGHITTVKLLLDEGADVKLKNDVGWTALDFAKKQGHKDIADGLAKRAERERELRQSAKPWADKR